MIKNRGPVRAASCYTIKTADLDAVIKDARRPPPAECIGEASGPRWPPAARP